MAAAGGSAEFGGTWPSHLQSRADININLAKPSYRSRSDDELRGLVHSLTQELEAEQRSPTFRFLDFGDPFTNCDKLFFKLAAVKSVLAEREKLPSLVHPPRGRSTQTLTRTSQATTSLPAPHAAVRAVSKCGISFSHSRQFFVSACCDAATRTPPLR